MNITRILSSTFQPAVIQPVTFLPVVIRSAGTLSVVLLLLFGLMTSAVAFAAESDIQAAVMANPCAGCHGTDGKSTGTIPPIDSLSSSYISSAMKAFKSDQRPGSVMNRIAKGYTDAEIDLIAKYFESVNKK